MPSHTEDGVLTDWPQWWEEVLSDGRESRVALIGGDDTRHSTGEDTDLPADLGIAKPQNFPCLRPEPSACCYHIPGRAARAVPVLVEACGQVLESFIVPEPPT